MAQRPCLCPRLILRRVGQVRPKRNHRRTFGPAPLQSLHPYYERLCPCAPHRYSGARGVRHLRCSLRIGTTGSPVPHRSLIRVLAAFMPGTDWALHQVTPQPCPRAITPPGFDAVWVISTRHRSVHFRSTPRISPDTVKPCLFHRRSPPRLLTSAARGGLMPAPARRHRGALPHLR